MKRILDQSYDELIIGANLDALQFSLQSKIPIIFIRKEKPILYDFFLNEKKYQKFDSLMNEVAFLDLFPFSNLINSIKLENNIIKLFTKNNLLINITYNKIYIYDDFKVEGLPISIDKTSYYYLVNDVYTSSSKLDKQVITSNEDLIHTLYINEQIISVSKILEENLEKFEWSHTATRLKILKFFKDKGIKLSIKPIERKIYPLGKNIYKNLPDNIIIK